MGNRRDMSLPPEPAPGRGDHHEVGLHGGRRETPTERLDRLWADLLQELRVTQTGAQLMAGFLLTLPVQPAFGDLDNWQKTLYLILVLLAVATTALVLTAIAVHQRLSGRHLKQRVVAAGRLCVAMVLLTLALLLVGISVFVFDLVVSTTVAVSVGGAVGVVLVLLLVVLPHALVRLPQDHDGPERSHRPVGEGRLSD